MTTHTVAFPYSTGQTLTAKLFTSADALEDEASSVVEATNRKQRYVATFEDVAAGDYWMVYYVAGEAAGFEEVRFTGVDTEEGILLGSVSQVYKTEVVHTGTTTTASTAGLFKVNTTGFPANSIRDARIVFESGALAGQARIISAFTVVSGTEDQIAVSEAFSAAPSPGDSFTIRATHTHTVLAIQTGLATPADVNAQVLDVLSVDTFNELAAPPAASSSLKDKLTWMFMWMRNKSTENATQRKLYADDATTVVSTETVSDAAGTFTKGEQS